MEPRLDKRCSRCGEVKSIGEFYLRRATGRRVAACRRCMRAAARRWHAEQAAKDPVGYRERRRELYEREDKERRRARWRRFYARLKRRAEGAAERNRFRHLRLSGLLELAERCADCGGKPRDLHHWVEEGVLHLVSLCHRCHMRRHFAEWRRRGGGPLRRYWEFDGEEEEKSM